MAADDAEFPVSIPEWVAAEARFKAFWQSVGVQQAKTGPENVMRVSWCFRSLRRKRSRIQISGTVQLVCNANAGYL